MNTNIYLRLKLKVMKKLAFSFLIMTLALGRMAGQDIPAVSEKLINDYVFSTITVEKERLDPEALSRVFSAEFYKAVPTYHKDGGTSSCESYIFIVINGKISELEETTETKPLDRLYSLVRKDFTIKNESDALAFEKALDAIYPLDWSVEPEKKKHFLKDGKWYFIRGEFFDSQKGFIITLNQNSGISQITYDLEAIKKQ